MQLNIIPVRSREGKARVMAWTDCHVPRLGYSSWPSVVCLALWDWQCKFSRHTAFYRAATRDETGGKGRGPGANRRERAVPVFYDFQVKGFLGGV